MLRRKPHLSANQKRKLLKYFCVGDNTASGVAKLTGVSRNTVNHWFTHFRASIMEDSRIAPRFMGEVEIDQGIFGKRSKKKQLRDLQYGIKPKVVNNQVKVLGILNREGKVYTKIIPREDRATIFPIVHMVIEPGTTIYTDHWRAFETLGIEGYNHTKIKHSEAFTDKDGNHINGIEAFWSFVKRRLTRFNGLSKRTLPLHIKECEYRYNLKNDDKKLYKKLKELNKGIYPKKKKKATKGKVKRLAPVKTKKVVRIISKDDPLPF